MHVQTDSVSVLVIPCFLLVTWLAPNVCSYALRLYDTSESDPEVAEDAQRGHWLFATAGGVALAVAVHSLSNPSEFIYFQF